MEKNSSDYLDGTVIQWNVWRINGTIGKSAIVKDGQMPAPPLEDIGLENAKV